MQLLFLESQGHLLSVLHKSTDIPRKYIASFREEDNSLAYTFLTHVWHEYTISQEHCKVTSQIWALFLSLSQSKWIMLEHTTDLLSCWIRRGGSKSHKKWLRIIPSCIWWTTCKERNKRCSEGSLSPPHKIKWNCIVTFYVWGKEERVEEAEQLTDLLGLRIIVID